MTIIYENGKIITADSGDSIADSMVVSGDEILYVGKGEVSPEYADKDSAVVDLEGKTVIPGFIESHMHLTYMADNLMKIDCVGKTKEEILKEVEEFSARIKPEDWILGYGWKKELWKDKSLPTREDLDRVSGGRCVCLDSSCGHMSWVSSSVLAAVGIDSKTPQPAGGKIYKDEDGAPTGCLVDEARNPVMEVIPPFSKKRFVRAMGIMEQRLVEKGITTVCDAGITGKDIDRISGMYENRQLKIRYNGVLLTKPFGARPRSNESNVKETLEKYYSSGPVKGLYDDKLSVRAVKIFTDGSMGAGTAWMLEPYCDDENNSGFPIVESEELAATIRKANECGFQVVAHAIGDAAARQVIDAYEGTMDIHKGNIRNRIEHFQVAKIEDIRRLEQTGTIPCMQPAAMNYIDMMEDKLDEKRLATTSSWRKIIDEGNIIPLSSDAPVDDYNPFTGIYNAVARKTVEGYPEKGWRIEEGLTRIEAIKGYTSWAAYALHNDKKTGSLEKGKKADFLIIDEDILSCDIEKIKDIEVKETVIGGETVFRRN